MAKWQLMTALILGKLTLSGGSTTIGDANFTKPPACVVSTWPPVCLWHIRRKTLIKKHALGKYHTVSTCMPETKLFGWVLISSGRTLNAESQVSGICARHRQTNSVYPAPCKHFGINIKLPNPINLCQMLYSIEEKLMWPARSESKFNDSHHENKKLDGNYYPSPVSASEKGRTTSAEICRKHIAFLVLHPLWLFIYLRFFRFFCFLTGLVSSIT